MMWYYFLHMETNEKINKYLLPIAVIIGCIFIAGAVIWNGSHPSATGSADQPSAPKVDIKNVKIDGDPFIGAANAPVTIAFLSLIHI